MSRWVTPLLALTVASCTVFEDPGTPRPTGIQLTPTPATSPTPAPATDRPAGSPPATSPTSTPPPVTPAPTFDPDAVSVGFETFVTGLEALTHLTHAGDGSGRLYAVERAGRIHVIEADGSVHGQPFLDITDRVTAGGERGLLGLAFHPDYADNGRLFVNYIDGRGHTVVAEFARATDTTADAGSERQMLYLEQPFGNHNGGMVEFGPDGRLYVSSGDGGGAGDPQRAGQDLSTLLGKLLRIDVNSGEPYALPADNPFVGRDGAQHEIWAWGLRNPWRFSFDPADGALFIADVGQNRWEEINAEPAGAGGRNYGWNVMEGPECFRAEDCDMSGLTPPVAWYSLDGPECAVIGGYVYRGAAIAGLHGAYLLADHCSGNVWALDADAAKTGQPVELRRLASVAIGPTSFGRDESGNLYLAGINGDILRLAPSN